MLSLYKTYFSIHVYKIIMKNLNYSNAPRKFFKVSYLFYHLSPNKLKIIIKKLQLQLIFSQLIIILSKSNSSIPGCSHAIPYAKHSTNLKCFTYNEIFQELNFIRLLIIFHKVSLNVSLTNSLRTTTTNMTHFMVPGLSSNSYQGISALHFDLAIRELSSEFQKHFFSKRILAVLWINLLDVLKHFFS